MNQPLIFRGLAHYHMDVSENSGVLPPNHPFFNRVFHDFHHPFWGPTPVFGNTHVFLGAMLKLDETLGFLQALEAIFDFCAW